MTTTTSTVSGVTDEIKAGAFEVLRKRLAALKAREDVEILAILGVQPGSVQDWMSSEPGLIFTVGFTFTTGRRQTRTEQIGFRLLPPFQSRDSDVLLPAEMLTYLSASVYSAKA